MSLRILWSFFKKYWAIFVALLGVAVGYFLLRRNNIDVGKIIQDINDDHQKDLNSINSKNDAIEREKEKIKQEEQKKLDELNKKYEEEQKKLEEEQKKNVDQILEQTNSDPDELAKKIAQITGSTKI